MQKQTKQANKQTNSPTVVLVCARDYCAHGGRAGGSGRLALQIPTSGDASKSQEAAESKRGLGTTAGFMARNRFAVLDKNHQVRLTRRPLGDNAVRSSHRGNAERACVAPQRAPLSRG